MYAQIQNRKVRYVPPPKRSNRIDAKTEKKAVDTLKVTAPQNRYIDKMEQTFKKNKFVPVPVRPTKLENIALLQKKLAKDDEPLELFKNILKATTTTSQVLTGVKPTAPGAPQLSLPAPPAQGLLQGPQAPPLLQGPQAPPLLQGPQAPPSLQGPQAPPVLQAPPAIPPRPNSIPNPAQQPPQPPQPLAIAMNPPNWLKLPAAPPDNDALQILSKFIQVNSLKQRSNDPLFIDRNTLLSMWLATGEPSTIDIKNDGNLVNIADKADQKKFTKGDLMQYMSKSQNARVQQGLLHVAQYTDILASHGVKISDDSEVDAFLTANPYWDLSKKNKPAPLPTTIQDVAVNATMADDAALKDFYDKNMLKYNSSNKQFVNSKVLKLVSSVYGLNYSGMDNMSKQAFMNKAMLDNPILFRNIVGNIIDMQNLGADLKNMSQADIEDYKLSGTIPVPQPVVQPVNLNQIPDKPILGFGAQFSVTDDALNQFVDFNSDAKNVKSASFVSEAKLKNIAKLYGLDYKSKLTKSEFLQKARAENPIAFKSIIGIIGDMQRKGFDLNKLKNENILIYNKNGKISKGPTPRKQRGPKSGVKKRGKGSDPSGGEFTTMPVENTKKPNVKLMNELVRMLYS